MVLRVDAHWDWDSIINVRSVFVCDDIFPIKSTLDSPQSSPSQGDDSHPHSK